VSSPLLFVLVFLTVLLALHAVQIVYRSRRPERQVRARARLRRMAAFVQAPVGTEDSILRPIRDAESLLVRWMRALPPARALAGELYRAGLPMSIGTFTAMSAAFAALGFGLATFFFSNPGMGLLGLVLAGLPWLQLRRQRRSRARRFEEQFPDALELLIRALRAGHSLRTGMQLVGEELPDPVGTEFAQVAHEIRLGQEVKGALANLAHRVDSDDLPFFITAIAVQQETGSNLAEVLANLSHVIRERFRLYGKVRALTALGRGSANLLAVWPFVTVGLLLLTTPDYVAPLFESAEGHQLVLASLAMIVVGYVVCRRMATIRV
jgi:tight adherence protein B